MYVSVRYVTMNANMNVNITIERSILPLPPVELDTETKKADYYWGIGSTLVAIDKSWFIMADANHGKSCPNL